MLRINDESFSVVRDLAEAGDAEAQFELACRYDNGTKLPEEVKETSLAWHWLLRAADNDYFPAQILLAYQRLHGYISHSSKSPQEYLHAVLEATDAHQTTSWMKFGLGLCYLHGIIYRKCVHTARAFFEQAVAQDNHKQAASCLITIYSEAASKKNLKKIFELAQKIAATDDTKMIRYLGYLYINGYGTNKDIQKGIMQCEIAAKRGDGKARQFLAECCAQGNGVVRNETKMREYLVGIDEKITAKIDQLHQSSKRRSSEINFATEIGYEALTFEGWRGAGNFSSVYRARLNGEEVAVKILFNPELPKYFREIKMLEKLQSPYIVKYIGVIKDMYTVVTELMDQTLNDLISHSPIIFNTHYSLQVMLEISYALSYLKSQDIIHGDIKPDNILVSQDRHVKIADFGGAIYHSEDLRNFSFTWNYAAPELFAKTSQPSFATDIYAAGCTFYRIVTQESLYPGVFEVDELKDKVLNNQRPFLENCPAGIAKLIRACWHQTPSQRPIAEAITEEILRLQT